MTAFILKTFSDRIEILSDGAAYEPDGTFLHSHYKVLTSEVMLLAVVGSGTISDIYTLSAWVIAAVDVAGSVDEGLSVLRGSLAKVGAAAVFDSPVRIAIAAISETAGPTCFVFSTFDDANSDAKAFELREARSGVGQGCLPGAEILAAQGVRSGESLEKNGVFLFEHMRRSKMTNPAAPDREPFHSVGGQLDFTVVHADWYEHRVLHTWSDEVGQKIDPFKGEAVAA